MLSPFPYSLTQWFSTLAAQEIDPWANNWTLNEGTFIHHIFTEHLLCTRPCSRCWAFGAKPLAHRIDSTGGSRQ